MEKACVPWLSGVKAVHITCGVALQAAVSDGGELLLWGDKQCMPASMLGQAQVLGTAAAPQAAASTDQGTAEATGVSTAQEAARLRDAGATGDQQLLNVHLQVQTSGNVKLVLACHDACSEHTGQATYPTGWSVAPADAKVSGQPLTPLSQQLTLQQKQQPQQQTQQQQQQGSGHGTDTGFRPQDEPIADLASGASHQVVLCQPSQHTPNHGELRSQ
jgi:hypothetical protein